MGLGAVAYDSLAAVKLATTGCSERFWRSWIYTPIGVVAFLAACFGVDSLFKKLSVAFPASVACLLLLFFALLLSEAVLGGHKTKKILSVIEIPAGWLLRWINIFFTPSFVTLPLSPSVRVTEVMKIIAVFVFGYLVMIAVSSYLARALSLFLGSSKTAQVQRAEELGEALGVIPMANSISLNEKSRIDSVSPSVHSTGPSWPSFSDKESSPGSPQEPPQLKVQIRHHSQYESQVSSPETPSIRPDYPSQIPPPQPRSERWAAFLETHSSLTIYLTVFLFVGLPVYYVNGYAMPAQLTINTIAFLLAMVVPATWRQFLHPVVVSSLITVLAIWGLAEIRGDNLNTALREYKNGSNYLKYWEDPNRPHQLPGAGDLLSSILDASIVCLALPMFQYRRELKEHFVSIIVPDVVVSVATLFAYPPLCRAIGLGAQRSLALASRSLTLAMAIPATQNLGGDVNTVAPVTLVSGITGALVGQRILNWLRVPESDYVARGVSLGISSSAIATASLLKTDPRAAALSSLSMILFGFVTVLLTSIPPVVAIIRSLVGL
ncbi:hypothetical protein PT974_03929 [Cladobotryum mycophilum]|uniref:Uncharacterized protein n=1 Tax=Cladobotryum mycophilum TaxID=491253 RepID=A0ABR0SUU5_9HYPO